MIIQNLKKNRHCLKSFIAILVLISQIFSISSVFAVSDDFNVNLQVEAETVVCDIDGVCDTGETSSNCSADCGCNNNGSCQTSRGEDSSNCTADCAVVIHGGDLPDIDPPSIYSIDVFNISLNGADISWKTTEQARCNVFLGETLDYENAVLAESSLLVIHLTNFIGLLSGVSYNFKISCKDAAGNESATKNNVFFTLSLPDTTPPENISDFEAFSGDGKVPLEWKNPGDEDFEGVLIVRDTNFYPQKPWEGVPVYDGKGEGMEDLNLNNGKEYYYTAFVYDKSGNYSSGAVVSGIPNVAGIIPPIKPPVEPPIEPASPEVEKIKLDDFKFYQGNQLLPVESGEKISIYSGKPFTANIEYGTLPEVLKTVMVTLEKDKKYFSFLLRINKDKTKYTATLAALEPGEYPMSIYVLDYKNQALKKIQGILKVSGLASMPIPPVGIWQNIWQALKNERNLLILVLIFIVVILILLYLVKRKQQKNQNDS